MIYLLGSIVLTSYLTLSFKVLERFGIPIFPSIVFNHVVCVITGSLVNNAFPLRVSTLKEPWFVWALVMGSFFIALFNLIGFTAQKIGVAVASVANKLSLVVPFCFSLYLYNEKATAWKIAGIVVALAAVVFTCLPAKKTEGPKKASSLFLRVLLPAILFFGSGVLDTMIKYVEHAFLNGTNNNAFLITAFTSAATIGLMLLAAMLLFKKYPLMYVASLRVWSSACPIIFPSGA